MAKKAPIKLIPEYFDKFPKDQWTPEIAKTALERNPWNIEFVPRKFLTKELCQIVIEQGILAFIPKKFITYTDYVNAVKRDIRNLDFVPYRFLTAKFFLEIAKHDPFVLHSMPKELITQEFCNAVFEVNPHWVYVNMPAEFKTKEMSEEVMISGTNLLMVPEKLRTTRIYKLALWRNSEALANLPTNLINQKICNYAVTKNWKAIKAVPEKFKTLELCLAALSQSDEAKSFIPQKLINAGIEKELEDRRKSTYSEDSYLVVDEYEDDSEDEFDETFDVEENDEAFEKDVTEEEKEEDTLGISYADLYINPKDVVDAKSHGIKQFLPKDTPQWLVDFLVQSTKDVEDITLEDVPERFRSAGLCKNMVKVWGKDLEFVPEKLKTPELCRLAVRSNAEAIFFVPPELLTEDLCLFAVKRKPQVLNGFPEEAKTKKICMQVIKENPQAISLIPEKYLTKAMIQSVLAYDPSLFDVIPDKFKTLELCKRAVRKYQYAMESVPEAIKTKEFCEYAVNCHGTNLIGVPEKFKTRELCEKAINVGPNGSYYGVEWSRILKAIPKKYRTSELYEKALNLSADTFKLLPDLQKTLAICFNMVQEDPRNIQFVPKEKKEEIIDMLIQKISEDIENPKI